MPAKVIFTPEAADQLVEIYRYITVNASPEIAENYTSAIIEYCEGMQLFPQRGVSRDDIRPGLRMTYYKKRIAIAFTAEADRISIIGIFYGGRDYETALQSDMDF